jgi:hypothetical protein
MSHSCVCRSLSNLNFGLLKETRECFLVTSFFCSAFFLFSFGEEAGSAKKIVASHFSTHIDHVWSSAMIATSPPPASSVGGGGGGGDDTTSDAGTTMTDDAGGGLVATDGGGDGSSARGGLELIPLGNQI